MAATYAQPGSSQPIFVPPGTAAVPPQVPVAAPGNVVMYYPQGAGGAGAVIVVRLKTISALIFALRYL